MYKSVKIRDKSISGERAGHDLEPEAKLGRNRQAKINLNPGRPSALNALSTVKNLETPGL